MAEAPGIEAALKALRASYIEQLPAKIGDIEQRWHEQRASGDITDESRDLLRLIHSLAGSGASFGFAAISERARELELYFAPFVKQGKWLGGSEIQEFERLCQQLHLVIDQASQAATSEPVGGAAKPAEPAPAPVSPGAITASVKQTQPEDHYRPVYLVDDDALMAEGIAEQLEHYGYRVRIFTSPTPLLEAIRQQPPEAILMDMEFPKANGAKIIADIRSQMVMSVPVVFVSGHRELEARLAAVRAGSDDYLSKPVNIGTLVDKLDRLTRRVPSEPHRVMVVSSNSHNLSRSYQALSQAGVEVKVVEKVELTLEMLNQFQPELLLLDVNMNYCSGIELARVIRQCEQQLDLPLVLLAESDEAPLGQDAIRYGGDDFLVRPFSDTELISVVKCRIERYRLLRRALEQDGLTGLLNHSRLTQALLAEYGRSSRYQSKFCFAMIDVDHFKSVNDQYGHPVGDEVLRSLSRLLKQKLRKSDIIGRYGGEEFGIVMVNVSVEEARQKINELREEFASITHVAPQGLFQCSFSAGIAAYPGTVDVKQLVDQADQALYRAKDAGRNCVFVA